MTNENRTVISLSHPVDMRQEILTELRWYFTEANGDLGLRSNFESVARRIGGIYAPAQTSRDLDGRLFGAAVRHRRVNDAIKTMNPRSVVVLHAFAMHEMVGVMLIQKSAIRAHKYSRSSRSLPDWLDKISPSKEKPPRSEQQKTWLCIRADATRELDRALNEFSTRWHRR